MQVILINNGLVGLTYDCLSVGLSLQKTLASLRAPTFVVAGSAIRTEILLVVPGQVPSLSRSHTAAFTPNACHAHLHIHNEKSKNMTLRGVSSDQNHINTQ